MLCSQALANIIEIFQNKYHVYLHFIFAHLHLPCFSAEAYSEPLQTSKVFEYACVHIPPGNGLRHHNKYLMGYFEFLHGSRIICLPLNILEKLG